MQAEDGDGSTIAFVVSLKMCVENNRSAGLVIGLFSCAIRVQKLVVTSLSSSSAVLTDRRLFVALRIVSIGQNTFEYDGTISLLYLYSPLLALSTAIPGFDME